MLNNMSGESKVKLMYLCIVLAVVGTILVALPLANGLGASWGASAGQTILAQAELTRSKAVEWDAVSGVLQVLPPTLEQSGLAFLQAALGVAIFLLGLGIFAVMLSLAYNFSTYGKVRLIHANMVATSTAQSGHLLAAPKSVVTRAITKPIAAPSKPASDGLRAKLRAGIKHEQSGVQHDKRDGVAA